VKEWIWVRNFAQSVRNFAQLHHALLAISWIWIWVRHLAHLLRHLAQLHHDQRFYYRHQEP
jgi:hypothetical protein